MEETKKYLDLEGLKRYHRNVLELQEQEKQAILDIILGGFELGRLGVEEEGGEADGTSNL